MKTPPPKSVSAQLANRLLNGVESERSDPAWLIDCRRAALQAFLKNELPTRKTEAWKYTSVIPLMQTEWNLPSLTRQEDDRTHALTPFLYADDVNIVFINGAYAPHLSTTKMDDGIDVIPLLSPSFESKLRELLDRPDSDDEAPFAALNRSIWHDGIALSLKQAAATNRRIHVLMLHAGEEANLLLTPRLYVNAEAGSESHLTITHASISAQGCLNIPCVDIDVSDGARFTLCQTQAQNRLSHQIGSTRIRLGRDSTLHSLDVSTGGSLTRQNLMLSLNGTGADAVLNGIYTLRGTQHTDFHTVIEHRQPDCRSRQVYKGIIDDQASAVFNGAVHVSPGACRTDGYQLNRTLLRSPDAKVFTKPELRIDNDDVRCSHGATIGQLDPQQIFYLQSRGIAPEDARNLLARGFVNDLLFSFPSRNRREVMDRELERFFNQEGAL